MQLDISRVSPANKWDIKLNDIYKQLQRMLFFLLCKHTNDDSFDYFPKISEHFSKIL